MDLMRTVGRHRSPTFPPGIPAEQVIAYKRESAYAMARTHGGDSLYCWDNRVKEHIARFRNPFGYAAPSEPHTCMYCQKLVIDVSVPLVFNTAGTAIYPKALNLGCSLQDARDGAKHGCEFFEQLMSQWRPPEMAHEDEQYYHVFAYGHVDGVDAEFDLLVLANVGIIDSRRGWSKWDNANHSDKSAPLATVSVYTESDDPASKFVMNRPACIDPWPVKTIEMIRSTLTNCPQCYNETNQEVKKSANEQSPARLLAISKGSGGWSLKLEQVIGNVPRYCTLSYCWGSVQKGFTTSTNLEERGTHIEFSTIAKTIQDAIVVSWDLGVHHLWVDALCIVQDHDVDKAVEISKMSHIFAAAYLTICTSRSLFADDGFLLPRALFAADSSMFRLAYQLPHEEGRGSIVLYNYSTYSQDNRLETRAWGFQERMLSRRILDFDGTTTAISCCHADTDVSHSYHDGGPSDHARDWRAIDYYRQILVTFDDIEASSSDHMAVPDIVQLWSDIVQSYTERNVTNTTDRVLALAAVAERFARFTKDEYVGGLWKRTLPWSLMWCMRTRKFRPPRPRKSQATYQGPSWSWLAINGPVHFFHAKELLEEQAQVLVEYVGHEVDLQYHAAPYGSVKSASIALKGYVRKARWIRNDHLRRGEDYDSLAIHEADQPDWSSTPKSDRHGEGDRCHVTHTSSELVPARILPDALDPEFSLPIASGGSAALDVILLQMFKRNGVPIGLVLRQPEPGYEGFYERLGVFYFSKGEDGTRTDIETNSSTISEKAVDEDGVDASTVQEKQGEDQSADGSGDDEELLALRWEYAEDMDGKSDSALFDDMKPRLRQIGEGLDNDIQKKVQDERDDRLWEKWKGWFDEGDNEAQVLVLI